jgi:hypothetical protein
MLDTAPCLWDPATKRIYTFMIPGANESLVCAFGGQTLAKMIASGDVSADARIVPQDEALALQEATDRQRFCIGPQRITAERFDEMLNCLPPQLWTRFNSQESFRISEPLTSGIWTWCVRIGDHHFTLNESPVVSHPELVRQCLEVHHGLTS